jgi:hypothetical protein
MTRIRGRRYNQFSSGLQKGGFTAGRGVWIAFRQGIKPVEFFVQGWV